MVGSMVKRKSDCGEFGALVVGKALSRLALLSRRHV